MKFYQSEFIPIKPISINECFQGRRYKTSKFKKWQRDVLLLLPKQSSQSKRLAVEIRLYFKNPLRCDADNFCKAILDCLTKKGVIKDDRYIEYLEVIKQRSANEEGFEIEINEIE